MDGLSAEARERLRSLWVESVEEYLALMAASDAALLPGAFGAEPGTIEASRQRASATLAPARAQNLLRARPGGPLGLRVRPEMLALYKEQGRIGPQRQTLPSGFAGKKLPTEVRLMESLPPVKDQGERGTCVAFAAVALREFLAGGATALSEQFLYWACKEMDGSEGPGTTIHTAISALGEYGVCPAGLWPYNGRQIEGNEAQGSPDAKVLKAAEEYRLAEARTVEPTLAEHYKQMLAGDGQTPGMPVVFATLVFNSWFMSVETHRTGKITIPLPGEQPLGGGHAWCIVGYADEASAPGGGYFIVRNSWSRQWAADSPEAPGHALMPYAYVEQCAVEAFTGPATGGPRVLPREQSELAGLGCCRVLSRDARDREGRLLPAGTAILGHPSEPDVFCEDTPARRKEFLGLDCAWSEPVRQAMWFPRPAEMPDALKSRLDELRSLKRRYLAAIQENLISSRGNPFPVVRVPAWFHALPYEWEPKVKRVEPRADLTDGFFEIAGKQSGARSDLSWPAEWTAQFKELNTVHVYSLSGFGSEAHVVVAFLTRFRFQRQAVPEVLPPDQAWVAAVEVAYNRWMGAPESLQRSSNAAASLCGAPAERSVSTSGDSSPQPKRCRALLATALHSNRAGAGIIQPAPNFTFFAIGTGGALAGHLENVTAGDRWVVLASPAPDGKWTSPELEEFPRRLALRDFLERLLPETREQRVCRVKECVDGLLIEGGNVTVERVKRETGYRRSVVRDAFFQLQKGAPDMYRLWRKDVELAIRKAGKGEPVKITSASFGRRFIRRHFLQIIGVGLGSALGLLAGWLVTRLGLTGYVGFLLGLLIAYVGNCMQNQMNRRADMEKEWG
ncbi:MAG: C1 family peptidase [Limisphaerales bacterium]